MSVADLNVGLEFACRFDETSGTAINDWKNCNVGTITGGTLNQAGPGTNKAITFNGTTDFLQFLNSTLLKDVNTGIQAFSYEIWFKTTANTSQTLMHKATSNLTTVPRFVATSANSGGSTIVTTGFSDGTASALPTTSNGQNDGTWRQLIMVRDLPTSPYRTRGYVNGSQNVLNVTNPITPDNAGSLFFGRLPGGGNFWNGSLALPRIWVNRALQPSEITELWNSGAGLDLYIAPVFSLRFVTPGAAFNSGSITLSIYGRLLNVGTSPVVKLKRAGFADVTGTSTTQVSSKLVTSSINLTGVARGMWDVYYQDSTGNLTLAGAISVCGLGTKSTFDINLSGAASGLWGAYYQDDNGNNTLVNSFTVNNTSPPEPTPSPLPGVSADIPSTSIKKAVNAARYKGSTVLDTTNEVGKERLNDISTFRDTILSVMKATSKADVHLNTSAGRKLKAIAALNPLTATAADIINAAKNG